MASHVVILIRSNPKESHRPVEAIRIALGLAAGAHQVDLILADQAPLLLTEQIYNCVDHEMAQHYFSMLGQFIPMMIIEKGSMRDVLPEFISQTIQLDWNQISEKIIDADCFISF